jgi:hypothetical protein
VAEVIQTAKRVITGGVPHVAACIAASGDSESALSVPCMHIRTVTNKGFEPDRVCELPLQE